jgi:hypothetical protein
MGRQPPLVSLIFSLIKTCEKKRTNFTAPSVTKKRKFYNIVTRRKVAEMRARRPGTDFVQEVTENSQLLQFLDEEDEDDDEEGQDEDQDHDDDEEEDQDHDDDEEGDQDEDDESDEEESADEDDQANGRRSSSSSWY